METNNERFFSVELKSKRDLKNVTLTNGPSEVVLIEGCIGELTQAVFVENVILEIAGKRGTLRINLEQSELKRQEVEADGSN